MNIIVTGASTGFGYEIAKRFVLEGHHVVGIARREEKLLALQKELGDNFCPVVLDLTDREKMQAVLPTLPFSDVDVLVNNAGLALGVLPAQQANFDDWMTMIQTNIIALTSLTHTLLPAMVKRNRGHIINIGSVAGSYPYPGGNVYGATKAYVKQFSLNLRADLLGTALRVTDIEPGLVGGTEFSLVRYKGNDQAADKVYENTLALSATDIAESVFWCATLPEHVNINRLEIMPVNQSFAGMAIYRDPK